MPNKLVAVLVSVAALMAVTLPMAAHHSFSAEFDGTKRVTVEGTVKMMEWVNPHSWLHINVTTPEGKVEEWKVEGGSPNVLQRLGWNRDSFPAGIKVKVTGSPAKDGSKRLNGQVEFPDGRKMSLGGSNPNEGNAPNK